MTATFTYEATRNEDGHETVTVFALGRALTATDDHPNFAAIKLTLADNVKAWGDADVQYLVGLFDIPFAVGQKFTKLTDRVSVSNNRVYFDGSEMHGALVDACLAALSDGADETATSLARFFDKVSDNPDQESRDSLYAWLGNADLQITEDGDFIAYKGVSLVDGCLWSTTRGTAIVDGVVVEGAIPNQPGSIIEMPRADVLNDPNNACGPGLHVANFNFADNWAGTVLKVKVHPRDVVSVPRHETTKMRVCRYTVLGEVEERDPALLVRTEDADDHLAEAVTVETGLGDDVDEAVEAFFDGNVVASAFVDDPGMFATDLSAAFEVVPPVVLDTIPSDVKALRQARGLSQRKLAKKAGVAKSYIGQIENGERVPSAEVFAKIIEALQ